jgi:hypothetical protein
LSIPLVSSVADRVNWRLGDWTDVADEIASDPVGGTVSTKMLSSTREPAITLPAPSPKRT